MPLLWLPASRPLTSRHGWPPALPTALPLHLQMINTFLTHLHLRAASTLLTVPLLPLQMGNPFLARQSYLAQEINWGCQFHEIICKPAVGEAEPHYGVQLDRWEGEWVGGVAGAAAE
jgi:hypothetical protein